MTDLEALKKKWSAAVPPFQSAAQEILALIGELAEANAAHDDAETRGDAALLDLRIANEALATFNARVLKAMRESQAALANARASALEEAARWHDAQAAELVIQFFPAHHRDALGGPVRAHDPEVFEEWAEHRRAATSIRALAKSPPSGRFVADEVMERVEKALVWADKCLTTLQAEGLLYSDGAAGQEVEENRAPIRAALAALNAEGQR